MLTPSSIFSAAVAVMALIALWRARAAVRRIERLSESYWELRYEAGQLKSRVGRLEVETGLVEPPPDPATAPPVAATFIPLSSLKK